MMPKVSVCVAVKNGSAYLRDQLVSILPQLAGDDEVIISDDHSSDDSVKIIRELNDVRIRVTTNPGNGVVSNFENALSRAQGSYIFLSDQDDVWAPNKISTMVSYLTSHDLVVCDSLIMDAGLQAAKGSFYKQNRSGKGLFRNLLKNSYMGCCMAFHRKVMEKALPFPLSIPMHDIWIGLVGELYFDVKFIDDTLVYHRRHAGNASTTSQRSKTSLSKKITDRLNLAKNIMAKRYAI
ncbi:MAG: glycosyltransferase [Cyclobacteriaceae bacterium]|nr:glycosyltransferase [Cyclobacteriaceae bacterium]